MAFGSVGDLWNRWNIRGFVMLSLFLQIFLVLFAPFRKKTLNHPIFSLLWLAYLMADWLAAFTIGLISHNQGNSCAHAAEINGALQAFWASFLLLHLGGPDTITAFSREDSSLWRRHLLSLIFQVGAAIYVFSQIFPTDRFLVTPTLLVFLAGAIKNAERTIALYLSSVPSLRKRVLSQLMSSDRTDSENDELVKELGNPVTAYTDGGETRLPESTVVKHAYYFQLCKVFVTNLIFTDQQRRMNYDYFNKVSALDALRVISVELHFIYEVLYTKALAIRSKWGYFFRFIALTFNVMAFILFNHLKEHRLPKLDVKITYSLLLGGIVIDVIALFMLVISDWTFAEFGCYRTGPSELYSFLHKLVSAMDRLRKPRFAKCKLESNTDVTYAVLDTPLVFRRWSETICACNLLSEKFGQSPRKIYKHDRHWDIISFFNICILPFCIIEKIISCFRQVAGCGSGFGTYGSQAMIANTKHISKNPFIKELWIFIFKELRDKCKNTGDPNEVRKIYEAKGNLFLEHRSKGIDCRHLLEYITETNYDTSIIIWHIATQAWYDMEKRMMGPGYRNDEMEYSKILSDYMFYLVVNQSNVMSAVGGISQVTSGRTLLQLRKGPFFDCPDVNAVYDSFFSVSLEKINSRTTRRAVKLVREIESLGQEKWKVMSGVWVEMLSYAAIHIKGEAHVQVLSEGGELLAFVWLLMAHFGCFNRPIFHPRPGPNDA